MDTIFENKNTLTREQMRDLHEYLYKPAAKRTAVLQGGAAAFVGVMAVLNYFDLFLIATMVFLVVLAVRNYQAPEKNAHAIYEKRLAYYDDVMPVTRTRFAERIYVEVANCTDVIEYRKIDKVVSMKSSYILFTKAPGTITLSRSGFTKGTFDEFKQFLRAQRPDLTIPD